MSLLNGLPYYKAYPRDFFEGTIGMDFEVKAAFRLLLDMIYMHGGRLVDDPRFIAGLMGCSVKKWNALRTAILATGKISVLDGYLGNLRADKELDSLKSTRTKQRENGSKPKKNNGLSKAMAEPKRNHTEPEPERKRDTVVSLGQNPDRFDEFWDLAPRKVAKPAALKSYAKALRSADAATIIAGMRAYAELRRDQDHQYTAHPSTWLNGCRWNDDPEPIPQQGTRNGKSSAAVAFGQSVHRLANDLSAGRVAIPTDDRNPFAPRSGGNPQEG